MCGKSSGNTTQTTTTELPPAMQAAYNSLVGKAQNIYNTTPYTPFSGGDTNSTIQSGTQALTGAEGAYQPYFNQANSSLASASTPAYQNVQNYMNPYQSDVVNATMANMNETNQQQQQGVVGNAIMSGAMGGDRVGVAQSELARQQDLANNQTLAQLNSQNYSQALGAAQQQQQTALGVAGAQAGMGSAATQNLTQAGMATTQAGEDQYNRDLALYQAQQSYPFQETSWLGNIVEGLGSTSGGTSSTTSNADSGNAGSSIFGGILGLASLLPKSDERVKDDIHPIGKTFDGQTIYRFRYKGDPITHVGMMAQDVEKRDPGAVHMVDGIRHLDYAEATEKAARKGHFATGGVVPYSDLQSFGGTQTGNAGAAAMGVIPATAGMGMGSGPRATAAPSPSSGQPDALSKLSDTLQQKAMSKGLDNIQGAVSNMVQPPAPAVANMTTPTSAPEGTAPAGGGGILGGIGNMLGGLGNLHFARGGIVRGYDDGGAVNGSQVFDPEIGWIPADDVPASDAAVNAVHLAPVPTSPDTAPAGSNASAGVVPTVPAAVPAGGVVTTAPVKDSAGQDIPPGYHEENGTVLADAPAPQGGVVAAAGPSQPSSNTAPVTAPQPTGGVVPPMPAPQWLPAAPKVKSSSQLQSQLIQFAGTKDEQYGLPAGTLWGMALPESGGDPGAHNRSGAAGIMQIMPATGASLGVKNPYDPYESIDAAGRLAAQNQTYFMKTLGRQPTAPDFYLMHNQGAGGAVSLLSNPNQPAVSLVGEASVVQNGGDPSMTGAQFAQFIESKFGNGGGGGASASANTDVTGSIGGSGVAPASVPAGAPATSSNGVAPASTDSGADSGGILGRIFSGQGMTDNQRLALLSAGLAIMGGKSRNPFINIGQGGLAGVQMYGTLQDRDRANALAQSEIATRQGDLGLKGKSIELAAQQLHQQAQQFQETYGLQVNQQQMDRYQRTPTMRGMLIQDKLNPQQPPQLIPYAGTSPQGGILRQQPPSSSPDASSAAPSPDSQIAAPSAPTAPAAPGSAPAIPPSPASTSAVAPASVAAPVQRVVNPNRGGGPLSNAAPAQANAPASTGILSRTSGATAPQPAQSAQVSPASAPRISLQPSTPDASQIPYNGMAFNPEGQKVLVDQTADALKSARSDALTAQNTNLQLDQMAQEFGNLPSNGMLAQGAGFGGRLEFAKNVNALMQTIHLDPIWDPQQIAAGEGLEKGTTRLGFEVSQMLGKGEAGFITTRALSAVPGGANSAAGAQLIMSTMRAANQRKIDFLNYLQDWSSKTGGDVTGADAAFNKAAPPELYALGAFIPARAISTLRQHPETAAQFDQTFQAYGSGLSKYVLGAQ